MKFDKFFIIKIFIGILTIAGFFLVFYFFQHKIKKTETVLDIPEVSYQETKIAKTDSAEIPKVENPSESKELPMNYLLKVNFQSQAPFADWSEPYQNGCEEASIIIVKHYYKNQALSKSEMKEEIDSSVNWQIKNWGQHGDLDAEMTLKLAKEYFGLSGEVVREFSTNDLKNYIFSGLPVIVPTDGQLLGNPNFRGDGPEYHMLVVIGYDDQKGVFITNDPGTKNGEKYIYKYQTLIDAISGPKKNQQKAVVVLNN